LQTEVRRAGAGEGDLERPKVEMFDHGRRDDLERDARGDEVAGTR
jgi:hypothetical protein